MYPIEADRKRAFIHQFVKDSVGALKKYDNSLHRKLQQDSVKDFYDGDYQGLGIQSITEPIIKYLIFTALCDRYFMQSEYFYYYSGNKQLDLALFLGEDTTEHSNCNSSAIALEKWKISKPDYAIEMKWADFKTDGTLSANGVQRLRQDIEKLLKVRTRFSDKYLFQFCFLDPELYNKIQVEKIEKQINHIYGQKVSPTKKVEYAFQEFFHTKNYENKDLYFVIYAWQITNAK